MAHLSGEVLQRSRTNADPKPMSVDDPFSHAIVATIDQPLLVLDSDLRVVSANPAFCEHFAVPAAETEGELIYGLGNGQWDIPKLRLLLEGVLTEDRPVRHYQVEHSFPTLGRRIMFLNARRLRLQGTSEYILLAISDMTERESLLFELRGQKEFSEKLIDSVREGLLILHRDLRVQSGNKTFYELFEIGPEETEGKLVYEIGNRQWDIPELRSLLEDILPRETSFDDFEVEHEFEKIGRRCMLLNARRLDHLNLIVLAIRDITEERAARESQKVLTGELQHRVKNILTNVHALATQTRNRYDSLDGFFSAFVSRLDALARSQDRLVQSPTEAISLREILKSELASMGAEEGRQVSMDGPPVYLRPRDAQTVGLMIHELAMNAAKYGALTTPDGRIEVNWRIESGREGDHLFFDWRERGVTITATERTKGFGSEIIKRSLPYLLGGASDLQINPDGAHCRLDFPLPKKIGQRS